MAGQPKKRAMVQELERRTREEFGVASTETHGDYVLHWIASGGTVLSLAESIAGAKGLLIRRATLDTYLHDTYSDWDRSSQAARAKGAHSMVEHAAALADIEYDRDAVPSAKLRIDTKLKVATMFNRAEFGESRGASVTVNIASMHIDAMRRREIQDAIVLAIPEEAEVLSIEESTG